MAHELGVVTGATRKAVRGCRNHTRAIPTGAMPNVTYYFTTSPCYRVESSKEATFPSEVPLTDTVEPSPQRD